MPVQNSDAAFLVDTIDNKKKDNNLILLVTAYCLIILNEFVD